VAAAAPAAKLSAEERKQVDGVVAAYRRAKDNPEKLKQIDAAAEIGPSALNAIDFIVSRELNAVLRKYRGQVAKAATLAYAKRLNRNALPEIEALRKTVLDQARGDAELTKEMIVKNSDPALERLHEILLLDRSEVVDNNPILLKLREGLTPAGERWQRVREHQTKLENAAAKTDGKSDGKTDGKPSEPAVAPTFAAYLTADEEQVVGLALPMSDATRSIFAINASYEDNLDPEEFRCMLALNLTRVLLGLNCLLIDPKLVLSARDHSSDMAQHKFFAHESPVANKKTPWDRAKNFGTEASGENIAAGSTDGVKTNKQWWYSPGHHKNMLGDHQRVGVGRNENKWTEMFGR
jgi:uncharacterized protein YkwD